MSQKSDWMPRKREDQLTMGRNWVKTFREPADGVPRGGTKADLWGIPPSSVEELETLVNRASEALETAKNEETRTKVTNAACRTAFGELDAGMRDIKRRRLLSPPLTEADNAALGLKTPDKTQTASGEPTAQIAAEVFLTKGRHELGVTARFIKGSPDDRANKDFWYWYKVLEPGEKAPESPEELPKLFATKRRRDVIPFKFEDSGKTVWIAARVVNNKKQGQWGEMISAIIP